MFFKVLSTEGKLCPFQGVEEGSGDNRRIVWGTCNPPVSLILHRNFPPPLKRASGNRVLLEQAFVRDYSRNFVVCIEYHNEKADQDHIIAFTSHLLQGFRGKPAFVIGKSRRIFLDNRRRWQDRNFAIEGLLMVRGTECGIINDTDPDGTPKHWIIQGMGPSAPIVTAKAGYYREAWSLNNQTRLRRQSGKSTLYE